MKTLLLAAACMLITSGANAQTANVPTLASPQIDPYAARLSRDLSIQAIRVDNSQQRLRYSMDESEGRTGLAYRLAALANSGRCSEAIATARFEGDRAILRNLQRACAAR